MSVAVIVFLALTSVPVARGHGYLGKPQARNFLAGDRNAYCPHCGNGQANVCGDGGQWPSKSNYLDFYNGPQATYVAGGSVEFEITVTAHHKGHFEFSICDEPISSSTVAPQECLNRRVLQRVAPEQSYSDCTPNDERGDCQPLDERHPERWYLPPPSSKNVHAMRFKVPVDLNCESCTLQWRYWTANSCVPKVDYKCYFDAIQSKGWNSQAWCGGLCGGCGETSVQCNGEEFRNCADIKVKLSDGAGPTTTLRTGSPSTTSSSTVAPSSTTMGRTLAPSTASPSTIAPATTTSGGPVEECVPHSVLKCINGRSSYWPKCDPSQAKTNTGPHGYEFGFYCTQAWSDSLNAMLSDPVVGKCRNQQAIHNLLAQVAYETGYFSTVYQPRDGGAGLIHMIPHNWVVNVRDMESLWPGQGYEAKALSSDKTFFQNASYGWRSVAAWYKKTNRVIPGCNLDLFDHDFATQTRCILSWVNDRSSAYNIVADCLAAGPSTSVSTTSVITSTTEPEPEPEPETTSVIMSTTEPEPEPEPETTSVTTSTTIKSTSLPPATTVTTKTSTTPAATSTLPATNVTTKASTTAAPASTSKATSECDSSCQDNMDSQKCDTANRQWSMCSSNESWWHGECRATCAKCKSGSLPCTTPPPVGCDPSCKNTATAASCEQADAQWSMCSGSDEWWKKQCQASCRSCSGGLPPCSAEVVYKFLSNASVPSANHGVSVKDSMRSVEDSKVVFNTLEPSATKTLETNSLESVTERMDPPTTTTLEINSLASLTEGIIELPTSDSQSNQPLLWMLMAWSVLVVASC